MKRPPKRRDNLVVKEMESHGETYIIVKDPADQRYFKFKAWERDLLLLLDGSRDMHELVAEFDAKHPDLEVDTQWMVDYLDGLRELGLVEKTEQEKHLVMMDKLKTLRKRRFLKAHTTSIFQIEYKLMNPDRMLRRVQPWIGWLWSPWFVSMWIGVMVLVIGFLLYHWDLYWAGFFNLINPEGKDAWHWVFLIALTFGISIWHELGHAFTCRRFGGEVNNIGFMIFYFEPAFYADVSDSYMFPNRYHRIWVALGGPYFEMMICAGAVATWLLTPAEWWLHQLALALVFITGLSVAFNLNPLIKFDGYYVLMDFLDVPQLREDSFSYIGNRIKKHLFHLEIEEEPISRRRRRIFLAYGVGAVLYTTAVMLFIFYLFRGWLVGWLGPTGYVVLFALIFYFMRNKLKHGVRFMGHVWLDKKDLVLSPKGRLITGAVVLLVVLLLTVPRSATRIDSRFVVEPVERSVVRATTDGVVVAIHVDEGQPVAAGASLLELASPDLDASAERAEADLALARRGAMAATEWGDIVTAAKRHREASEAADRLRLFDAMRNELTLTAPISGVVTTWDLDQLEGRYVMRGEPLCTVARTDSVRLAIETVESDISEIEAGVEVRMLARAYPGRTIRAQVLDVAANADEPNLEEADALDLVRRVNLVRVSVEIDNADGRLRPGMTGRVQFLTTPRSPVGKTWWRFRRWAEAVVW